MIAQLRGTIGHIDNQLVVLEVKGVGYAIHVSGKTQTKLRNLTGDITVLTDMQVREDSITLFGFFDALERDIFRLLITVQGVGAKAAMAILSAFESTEITQAILAKDKAMVARADGVGPKIAQRIVNELSEKISKVPNFGSVVETTVSLDQNVNSSSSEDAISALVNLGYARSEAHTAVMRAHRSGVLKDVSSLITAALKELAR